MNILALKPGLRTVEYSFFGATAERPARRCAGDNESDRAIWRNFETRFRATARTARRTRWRFA